MDKLRQVKFFFQGRTFSVQVSKKSIEGDLAEEVQVVSINPTYEESDHWYTASLPPSAEDLKNLLEKGVKTQKTLDFMFCDERDKVLILAGEEAVLKYDAAMEALAVLREAQRQYALKMESLGATIDSEGSYEDFHQWYAINGIPKKFSVG